MQHPAGHAVVLDLCCRASGDFEPAKIAMCRNVRQALAMQCCAFHIAYAQPLLPAWTVKQQIT